MTEHYFKAITRRGGRAYKILMWGTEGVSYGFGYKVDDYAPGECTEEDDCNKSNFRDC